MSEITAPLNAIRAYAPKRTLEVKFVRIDGAYEQPGGDIQLQPGDSMSACEALWVNAKRVADYARSRAKTGEALMFVDGKLIVRYSSNVAVTRKLGWE